MMSINLLLDKIGELNPQLFREIKGRTKYSNILFAVVSSLILQILLFLFYLQYSLGSHVWEYTFLSLNIVFVFILLVGGTYLLISDLSKEENKGTLNFIRLSPQPETSILIGKMLGVPSLIYLFVLTAVPLHLFSGYSANFGLISIFGYYLLLAACCSCFYSLALLFAFFGKWLSNLKPWLGSGAVFLFLFMNLMFIYSASKNDFNNPGAWLRFFSPWDMNVVLFPGLFSENIKSSLENLQFFYIPVGQNILILLVFFITHYIMCSYGILQATGRIFRNQKTTLLSKKQSYLLTGFIQLMFLGLIIQTNRATAEILVAMLTFINSNLIIFLVIFLSPSHQHIQDWSRYSYQNNNKRYFKYFRQDLVWGEKSPATLAITINTLIAATPVIIWFTLLQENMELIAKGLTLLLVVIYISWLLILTNIIQLTFLARNLNIYMWVFGSAGMTIFLPIVIGYLLHIPDIFNIFTVLLTNFAVLSLLNWKFNRQVRVLGESATKALFSR
jgi:hypothetical protein